MDKLPEKGPISDHHLHILNDAGVLVKDGKIRKIGSYKTLAAEATDWIRIEQPCVALPGLIDCHTHICFAGSRAGDYTKRLSGMTYQEIAASGGGILDTVRQTRAASQQLLEELLRQRIQKLIAQGITTCEVKSGYGLTFEDELKMLRAITEVGKECPIQLIATCLAAHVRPAEFETNEKYLDYITDTLFPKLTCKRIDIFVEEKAFTVAEARTYLKKAQQAGFDITIHADQFSRGGAQLAAELNAISADHLECSTVEDAKCLAAQSVTAVVLPGASLGLGIPMPPARMLLDQGAAVAIASDWNPGSAPMGQLLLQAAVLGAQQKLTIAETFAGITCRAAKALNLNDRGTITLGSKADLALFPTTDYREILYHQGSLQPFCVVSSGKCLFNN
jgi:imidazolonepropionase